MRIPGWLWIGSFLVITVAFANWQVSLALAAMGSAPSTDAPELKIIVLQGQDGVNIIKGKTAVKPVVEVRDRNNLPVADATVTFLVPDSGPGVTFAHGSRILTTVTKASGRAAVASMKPVGPGAFKIGVTASFHGQVATAAIAQTNYLTAAAVGAAGAGAGAAAGTAAGGLSGAAIAGIVAGVAAAVAVGVAVGTSGGSKATPVPTGTIGPGSGPVIGPPH
jgi:hypothetical protein